MVDSQIPAATYRLQFNGSFGFRDARALVPYLATLGVTDLYASPLLAAGRGSTHGYDVTDPTRLNPELGAGEDFPALSADLRKWGLGLLLDIVPNHMAASDENPWWWDVLRLGPDSAFAPYFDIDWHPGRPGLDNKVLLPILRAPFGRVLENGELALVLEEGRLLVRYGKRRLPLAPASFRRILPRLNIPEPLNQLPAPAEKEIPACRRAECRSVRNGVRALGEGDLPCLNGRRGDPASFGPLEEILAEQAYRLAFWPLGNETINYRRFFDVTDLVALRVEDGRVFQATHAFLFRLIEAGHVQGLRIDHIDGLYDPQEYLARLARRLDAAGQGSGFYVVVEKILSGDEKLPDQWQVHGTTGYEFMNTLNNLFVDESGAARLQDLYITVCGSGEDFATVVYRQKKKVTGELFAAEAGSLARQLKGLAAADRYGRDLSPAGLAPALVEVTACLPVYRTYVRHQPVTDRDRRYIAAALTKAVERSPDLSPACTFLGRVLTLDFPPGFSPAKRRWLDFVRRWQQFTGPVMAKGCEDTALYIYNRLVSLNEVGGEPQATGLPVAEFHRRNLERQDQWPHALNATSTHDTKRSEDVRARINVLTEVSALWAGRVDQWRRWNRPYKPVVRGRPVPEDNLEYLIYQTLIGAWPLNREEMPAFRERLSAYLVKAAREAKLYTGWLYPDTDYEQALQEFTAAILAPGDHNRFLADFTTFERITAQYGYIGSLAQVLLKVTCPGVPDFYQGMELWRFNLVDPDSRRPVDFALRIRLLDGLRQAEAAGRLELVRELLSSWPDGRIKLYVTCKTLNFRRTHRELFACGAYLPVAAVGTRQEHVCAFARRLRNEWIMVAVPRFLARLHKDVQPGPAFRPADPAWGKSALLLPEEAPGRFRNIFTGEVLAVEDGGKGILPLTGVFANFPVALLSGKE